MPLDKKKLVISRRWHPRRVGSDLLLWMDASEPSGVYEESTFTTVATDDADPAGGIRKSGVAISLSQSNGTLRPAFKLNQTYGKPAILPDSVDDYMVPSANIVLPGVFTVVMIGFKTVSTVWSLGSTIGVGHPAITLHSDTQIYITTDGGASSATAVFNPSGNIAVRITRDVNDNVMMKATGLANTPGNVAMVGTMTFDRIMSRFGQANGAGNTFSEIMIIKDRIIPDVSLNQYICPKWGMRI